MKKSKGEALGAIIGITIMIAIRTVVIYYILSILGASQPLLIGLLIAGFLIPTRRT